MVQAAGADGMPRFDESDSGASTTFSGLLNRLLDWVGTAQAPFRADTGWVAITAFLNSFTAFNDSGWSGVRYRVKAGQAMVNGATARSSQWSGGTPMFTLPSTARPAFRIQGVNCTVEANGQVLATAGSGATSFSAEFPV